MSMETTENPTTDVKTSQPNNYVSIDQWIGKMKLTFDNAMLPEIFVPMQTVGYTEPKITALKGKLLQLENLQQTRTKEYAEQYAETDVFDKKCTENYEVYKTHRNLAKVLFKADTMVRSILKLDETSKRTYTGWYQEATNFYNQLAANTELLTKSAEIGLNAAAVTAQKQSLLDLQALKESQQRETAEAQAATAARDKAFDEFYPLYSDYIKYAKILLAGNQMLEALGIIVK